MSERYRFYRRAFR